MARILVIDDDALVRNSFSRLFSHMGHDVLLAESLASGETRAREGVDVIYLDLDLPDGNGLKAIDALAAAKGRPEVIVITGMGAHYGARRTLQSNAWDYITKPASPQVIKRTLQSALQYRKQSKEAPAIALQFDRCGIVGENAAMRHTLHMIEKAARSDAGTLISGETGVGKELIAKAIHANSPRKNAPFVVVDCSNMTDALVESMLYGHARGAFTGAYADRKGLVAEADGGTLFLDEVGELSLALQKSFLRVLQEHCFRPVGSAREQSSDFRLVAATNRDLDHMVQKGTFRNDVLFRIRTMEICVPPLRDREEDKQRLAGHFIHRFCDRYGLAAKQPSNELFTVIDGYRWPGNVRELSSAMEAAVINAGKDPVIYPKHLPGSVRLSFFHEVESQFEPPGRSDMPTEGHCQNDSATIPSYSDHKAMRDRDYFLRLLKSSDYDIARASRMAGLSVPSVYRHLALAEIPTRKEPDSK